MSDVNEPRAETAADAFLAALASNGVEWLFANAGTDFAPLIEALVRAEETGLDVPRAVEVLHETVAVAMAHGYWLATGRPQAAMVHVNVGTANALMGIINAARDQVPVLFASGRTPITEQGRLGSRNAPIHWGQEMFDQGGMLREFTKWDTEVRMPEQAAAAVDRAVAIARSEPAGPVYLSLPREVLAQPLPAGPTPIAPAATIPSRPHPDPEAVAVAAGWVAEAETPLVLTSGGSEEIFTELSALSERFALPVCQFWRTSCAVSTDHPFYAGENPAELLGRADVVLNLNTMVPWMPERMGVRDGARVVHIGPDPMFDAVPVRSFPSDLTITASVGPTLRLLGQALTTADGLAATVERRRAELVPSLAARRARERATGVEPGGSPMTPEFMSRTLSDVLDERAIVVNELGLAPATMSFTRWDSYFGPSISAGLGWGLGAALGVKLAHPDRQVVACVGDGSYVFANPAAAHHAAAALGLGLVTVVADNRVWNAVRRSTIAVYPEGRAVTRSPMPLSSLDPPPDYPGIAKAYGAHAEHVDDPDRLADTFRRALAAADDGRQALVSVHVSHPDVANH